MTLDQARGEALHLFTGQRNSAAEGWKCNKLTQKKHTHVNLKREKSWDVNVIYFLTSPVKINTSRSVTPAVCVKQGALHPLQKY